MLIEPATQPAFTGIQRKKKSQNTRPTHILHILHPPITNAHRTCILHSASCILHPASCISLQLAMKRVLMAMVWISWNSSLPANGMRISAKSVMFLQGLQW